MLTWLVALLVIGAGRESELPPRPSARVAERPPTDPVRFEAFVSRIRAATANEDGRRHGVWVNLDLEAQVFPAEPIRTEFVKLEIPAVTNTPLVELGKAYVWVFAPYVGGVAQTTPTLVLRFSSTAAANRWVSRRKGKVAVKAQCRSGMRTWADIAYLVLDDCVITFDDERGRRIGIITSKDREMRVLVDM